MICFAGLILLHRLCLSKRNEQHPVSENSQGQTERANFVNRPNTPDYPPGTILESDDEIRQAQQQLRSENKSLATTKPARPFRPTNRPPIALLTICDDGRSHGETVRIRDDQFIVGRTEGDLQLAV